VTFRNELQDKIVKIEYDHNTLDQKYQKVCETNARLSNELGSKENLSKKAENTWKAEKAALTTERDQLKRDYNKLLTKMNEIAKNTKKAEQVQNRLKE
jgi:hypothetical protein